MHIKELGLVMLRRFEIAPVFRLTVNLCECQAGNCTAMNMYLHRSL